MFSTKSVTWTCKCCNTTYIIYKNNEIIDEFKNERKKRDVISTYIYPNTLSNKLYI